MRGDETPGRIVTNCCTGVGVHDVITCADLYYDHLRGFGVAGSQILGFSNDLLRRPYNTLALPCECVIDGVSLTVFLDTSQHGDKLMYLLSVTCTQLVSVCSSSVPAARLVGCTEELVVSCVSDRWCCTAGCLVAVIDVLW